MFLGEVIVGGLVGSGDRSDIRYSYAAPSRHVSLSGTIGGLYGGFSGLFGSDATVTASYWDTEITMRSTSASNLGDGKITTALQLPTGFTGTGNIYALWGNFWCNPNTGEEMESPSQPTNFVRVWDLGTSSQYPALNCMPGGLSAQGRVDAFPGDACASADRDRDGDPDNVVVGCQTDLTVDSDDDNDTVTDTADACPRGDMGWISDTMTDNDQDGCRDEHAEDQDDDNDGVVDEEDVFPLDTCVSTDADNDGDPDTVVAGCQTDLTADSDDDNDTVTDTADACPLGDMGWISDTMTDNDGDGCRDEHAEDQDDDNDGVADEDDVFPLDACASRDTDNDGDPDSVVASCQTDLMADRDDDNDTVDDDTDNCRTVVNPEQDNNDPDEFGDACDVDDNNNGLIEIHTLDDLVRLRDDLDGDGMDDGRFDEIISVGSAGCPSSGCLGYELNRSLNFSLAGSYENNSGNLAVWTNRSGSGWEPIGFCSERNVCTAYSGVFDGRGYTLADLFVSAPRDANGVGLFAAFNGGRLQNLHLRNVRVSGGSFNVGGLVGKGRNASYENLSVTGGSVMSPFGALVGGLVGSGYSSDIRYAYVSGVDVSGRSDVGGLVGFRFRSDIRYAYVSGGSVSGDDDVGGLVGDGRGDNIRYAYVSGVDVSGRSNVGGLVGSGWGVDIRYAYVSGVDVSGGSRIGGLVGSGYNVEIHYSYWNTQTTGRPTSAGNLGEGKTTTELQSPIRFTGIYQSWGNLWCNPNTGEEMESPSQPAGFESVWDLGTSFQYPALNCMPGGLSAQGR